MSARNDTIQKLREELELIKASTLAEERQLDAETKAAEESDKNAFTAKETALSEELKRLTEELKTKRASNKEAEDQLRKRKVKYEGEASNWISKYDTEMEEKDKEISALRLIYDEERKELNRLETYVCVPPASAHLTRAQDTPWRPTAGACSPRPRTRDGASVWMWRCERRQMEQRAGRRHSQHAARSRL